MQKEELKFQDSTVFEGMTSIRAIIRGIDSGINNRRIKTILFDKDKLKKISKEVGYFKAVSDKYGFELKESTSDELDKISSSGEKSNIKLPAEESDYACPKCSKKMIYKSGRFGKFLACRDYPACRSTIAVDKDGVPIQPKEKKVELADFKCELCGGDVVLRNGKYEHVSKKESRA